MSIWKQSLNDLELFFYGEDLTRQMINIKGYMQEQEEILLACLSAGVNRADIWIYVQKDRLDLAEAATIVIGKHKETVELSV